MRNLVDSLSLVERIAKQLREKLFSGDWVPGYKLSEVRLSQSLNVSRNSLREAFRLLDREGLVIHEPNKGVSVVIPSMASILDIYRVRRMIECQALAHANYLHPAKENMRKALKDASLCQARADWQGVGTANMAFHKAVVQLADSERLNTMFSQVLVELRLVFGILKDAQFLYQPYIASNEKILNLLEEDRTREAASTLCDYLAKSERVVLAAYARVE